MLEALVAAVVPILVAEAEHLLGSQPQSNDWVSGLVNEIASLLDSRLPGWLKPEEEEIKALVEAAIEKLLPNK